MGLLACPAADQDPAPAQPTVWPTGDLIAVDVAGASHVIIVSAEGDVFVSRDAGMSWMSSRPSAEGRLHDVSMADRDVGWLVGDAGIWRTDDGGASWQPQRPIETPDRLHHTRIAAIDRDRAVAVGSGGMRAYTQDGGRSWASRQDPVFADVPRVNRSSNLGLACHPGGPGLCWSVGDGIDRSRDGGRSWSSALVIDPLQLDPVVFDSGEVDVGESDADRIAASVEAAERRGDPEWRLEPRVSQLEIERFGRRRDPDALFEVIAARIDETRGLLENAGVDLDRVFVVAAPPWDYANYLDDDPHFLDRYWQERSAARSSISIRGVVARGMTAIDLDADGLGLAVGASGALLRSRDGGDSWLPVEPPTPHDLTDVVIGTDRAVVVGAQGSLLISDARGRDWHAPGSGPAVIFFDTLRAVAFSPDWELGVIVGEKGRVLRSFDAGNVWRLLLPDAS